MTRSMQKNFLNGTPSVSLERPQYTSDDLPIVEDNPIAVGVGSTVVKMMYNAKQSALDGEGPVRLVVQVGRAIYRVTVEYGGDQHALQPEIQSVPQPESSLIQKE